MKRQLYKLLQLARQFGILFTIKYCYYKYSKNDEKYIKLIYEKMVIFLDPVINQYKNQKNESTLIRVEEKVPIWICWWQGYDNMPELCRICFDSIRKSLPENSELILITWDNYEKYVTIPRYVVEKVEQQRITLTHFSDILRHSLLAKYGGMWIDSSIYCAKSIEADFLKEADFWSIKLDKSDIDEQYLGQKISKCQWSSFIMKGAKDNLLNRFVLDAMLMYVKEYDLFIDYFLQNLLIRIGYDCIPEVKKMIDSIAVNNQAIYKLYYMIDNEYNERIYDNIRETTTFFKLTWKRGYDSILDNGKKTYYGHIANVD